MSKATTLGVLGLAIAALAIAGCGSGGDSTASDGGGGYGGSETKRATAPPSPEKTGAAVISVASVPELGRIIVDSSGHTLYDFHKDEGTASSCYGACAKAWPPLTTESAPQVGEGAHASKLGTTRRRDGTVQVTYAGHPLYTFAADTKPGEAKGNDVSAFGAEWYALAPGGSEPED
jgi:predicted lipoprotein with Yx(FWY)xxD motif